MNKITSRDIQMFIAGALALMGLHSLIFAPYYIVVAKELTLTAGALFSSLQLLIGIAILQKNERALFWARVFLWLSFVGAVISIGYAIASDRPASQHSIWWRNISEILTPVVLLWLLTWSQSARFYRTPNT